MQSEVHKKITNYMKYSAIYVTAPQGNEKWSPQMDEEDLRNPGGCAEMDLERWGKSDTLVKAVTVYSTTPQVLEETGRRWGILTMDLSLDN